MAARDRFRPYIGLPSEVERLQALRDFLHWVYFTYTSADHFFRDFHTMLYALRVPAALRRGRQDMEALTAPLQSLGQCQELQKDLRDTCENMLPAAERVGTMFPSPPLRALITQEVGEGERAFAWVYDFSADQQEEALARLRLVVLSRFLAFLDGLNTAALVRCAECKHYTVRRHPRGKEYCSPQCRWRAAAAARRATLKQSETLETKKPVSQRRRKEK